MKSNSSGLALLIGALLGGSLGASVARADAAEDSAKSAKDSGALDEVIVTAQLRKERAQDVPLSITAYDTAALESMGADSFVDYARSVPSLSFANRGANRSEIIIRGISPITGEAAVGLYLDGVGQSNQFNNPDFRLFDVERVEILRGPQGTLYGEGSLGGTIKILTNKPNFDGFEAKVEGTGSNTDGGKFNSAFSGLVNLPAGDHAAFRVSGFYRNEDGWIDNVADGEKNVNDLQSYGGRIAARFKPTDALDLQAIVNYQKDDVGNLDVHTTIPPVLLGFPPGTPPFARDELFAAQDEWEKQDNTQVTLLGDYALSTGSLEAVFGYNKENDDRAIDPLTVGLPPDLPLPLFFTSDSDTKVAEVRYLSNLGGSFDFVVGGFYRDRQRDNVLTLVDGAILFGLTGDFVNEARFSTKTSALYGEGYYRVGPLTWTLGLRAFSEKVAAPASTTIGDVTVPAPDDGETFNALTPKFGVSYKASDDRMYYFNVAEGFRSGGTNPTPSNDPNYVPAFDPDKAWSYELGFKSQFLDRRVTWNSSIYYIDWRDLQILGIPDNPALGFTTNAGSAHSKGVESELQLRASDRLSLYINASYTNAELDAEAQGAPAGTPLANVPDWAVNLGIDYHRPITANYNGFVRIDWSYKTATNSSVPVDPLTVVPAYDIGNIRFGIENQRYSATLFVDNFTNNTGITVAAQSGEYVTRLLTFGLTLRASF